jgi:hypothetical protein
MTNQEMIYGVHHKDVLDHSIPLVESRTFLFVGKKSDIELDIR